MSDFNIYVLLAQSIFILIAAVPVYIIWRFSRAVSMIIIALSIVMTIFGLINFNENIRLLDNFSVTRNMLNFIGFYYPTLVNTWAAVVNWTAFAVGSVTAWALSVIFVFVAWPDNNYVRGGRLLSVREVKRLLKNNEVSSYLIKIGQYLIPVNLLVRSLLIVGSPGSGKTLIISRIMLIIIKFKNKIFTNDKNGEMYGKFGAKGDVLINKGFSWTPFCEVKEECYEEDCKQLAHALIPESTGEAKTWNSYVRELLTVVLMKCWRSGVRTNGELLRLIGSASRDELKKLTEGTSAQRIFEPGNEKMLSGVLAIMNVLTSELSLLDQNANENSFSFTEWVGSPGPSPRIWLYYDSSSKSSMENLRAMWAQIIINETLSLPPNVNHNVFMILDELAANGLIPSLNNALMEGRKYGLCLIMGLQSIASLNRIYGRDSATEILASVDNNVILRTPDSDTAEYLSKTIGDEEIRTERRSYDNKGGTTRQQSTEKRRLVLPATIMGLKDLHGYIKISGVGWAELKVPIVKFSNVNIITSTAKVQSESIKFDSNNTINSNLDEI